jgi:hypothetical protein
MSQHKIEEVKLNTKGQPNLKDKKPGVYKCGNKIITHTGTETLVEQGQAAMTDINRLLEPAMKRGLLRHTVKFEGQYDDIPFKDLQHANDIIAKSKSMYEELPANIRSEFQSPVEFLQFVQNPANAERMRKMNILKGNDGLTASGSKSGAPTTTDMDGDGVPDPIPEPGPV